MSSLQVDVLAYEAPCEQCSLSLRWVFALLPSYRPRGEEFTARRRRRRDRRRPPRPPRPQQRRPPLVLPRHRQPRCPYASRVQNGISWSSYNTLFWPRRDPSDARCWQGDPVGRWSARWAPWSARCWWGSAGDGGWQFIEGVDDLDAVAEVRARAGVRAVEPVGVQPCFAGPHGVDCVLVSYVGHFLRLKSQGSAAREEDTRRRLGRAVLGRAHQCVAEVEQEADGVELVTLMAGG